MVLTYYQLLLSILPVTADRWNDLETLFGPQGAYWGCWCMYWRFTNKAFNASKKDERRIELKMRVEENKIPGLLAYLDDKPVGWMSISPKSRYARLVKSRVIQKTDDEDVLSIVCFFIDKTYTRQGISSKLIEAADDFARTQNYKIIEAYPVDNKGDEVSASGAYVGFLSVFLKLGYVRVASTKSKSGGYPRVIVRKYIE